MKERHIKGRASYKALADEIPDMFRRIANDLNTTPHPIRSIRVAVDENGYGYALIKWLWWENRAPMSHYPAFHRSKDDGEYFSVPYLGQLGSAFDAAADWIEESGIKQCSMHQDTLSGWWVLTIV